MSQRNVRSQASVSSQASARSQASGRSKKSLASQAQSESEFQTQTQTQITDEDIQEAAMEVVNFLMDYQNFGQPIKRPMISKNVPKAQGRSFNTIMNVAQQKLDDLFGIELIQVTKKNNLSYIMVNKLKSTVPEINVAISNKSLLKKNERYLLLLTLSLIKNSGGELKESTLLDFLKRVKIIDNLEKPIIITPYFAGIDLLKFLRNDLVGMLYLECKVNDEDGENEMRFYSWGLRAESEVDLNEIDAFYETVMQGNE